VEGYVFVEAEINGRGPFVLLVDSGASACSLTPKAARVAELRAGYRIEMGAVSGGGMIKPAGLAEVRAGTERLSGVEVIEQEIPAVQGIEPKAEGVLGQSFLSRVRYLIDYEHRRLVFGAEAETEAADLPSIAAQVIHGRFALGATIAGRRQKLVLDSGSAVILLQCAKQCDAFATARQSTHFRTNLGGRTATLGKLRGLKIGHHTISGGRALLIEECAAPGEEDGLLPTSWFSRVYVDGRRKEVRLGSPSREKR
jgi:predicted aspartyl protease